MNKSVVFCSLVLALCGAGFAKADITLLSLTDPPVQSNTVHQLFFTASSAMTDVSFAGYQVPAFERASHISLTSGGGGNLLGPSWTETPGPSGSDAFTFNDGTGVAALAFGGVVVGEYDKFDQTISTIPGQIYQLDFLYSNTSPNAPSSFLVASNGSASVTAPEPSGGLLLVVMLLGLVFVTLNRCPWLKTKSRAIVKHA